MQPNGGKRWRPRRLIQWPLQQFMMVMAKRHNMYLVRGVQRCEPIHARRFLNAPLFAVASDFVRNATLELLCRDITERDVSGALAELGVYQGDFALLMHSHLPSRPIHLFDTFEGFHTNDVAIDTARTYVDEFHDFTDTSAAKVTSRFPTGSRVVVHAGWFPNSAAEAVDERFALVSLDADLYQPIFAGLEWFWPRLSPGGFILVHDYNNTAFKGTKAAVIDFLHATPTASCCPIPDISGSAIIAKPLSLEPAGQGCCAHSISQSVQST